MGSYESYETFQQRVKIEGKCTMTSVSGNTKAKEDAPVRFPGTKPIIQPATASALHTNYVGQQQGGGVRCTYCRNYHLSASYTIVTDPAARRKISRQRARVIKDIMYLSVKVFNNQSRL